MMRFPHATLLCLGLLLIVFGTSGCRASQGPKYSLPKAYDAEQVPRVIAAAQEELAEGQDPGLAFARLDLAWRTSGVKDQALQSLERARLNAAEAYLSQLIASAAPSGHFQRLMDADLPRNQAVRTRIARARALLSEGERIKAYRAIKNMDTLYPYHAERQAAGRLLFDVGMALAQDRGRYGLFFRYRKLAPEVLEYMTTTYYTGEWTDFRTEAELPEPLAQTTVWPDLLPRECGAVAYQTLGELYAEAGEYDFAVQRLQDLVLYYGDSPLVREIRARIPALRLEAVSQADHDRHPIELARVELEDWLRDFQGQDAELEDQVRQNRLYAIRQLADHDWIVARFYKTVKNAAGALYHGQRALDLAQLGGEESQTTGIQEFLDGLRIEGETKKPSDLPNVPVKPPAHIPAEEATQ